MAGTLGGVSVVSLSLSCSQETKHERSSKESRARFGAFSVAKVGIEKTGISAEIGSEGMFCRLFGPFSLGKESTKIQIRTWELCGPNPHCKDLALRICLDNFAFPNIARLRWHLLPLVLRRAVFFPGSVASPAIPASNFPSLWTTATHGCEVQGS